MAFTDRFVQFPLEVYDIEAARSGELPIYRTSTIEINPFEISDFFASEVSNRGEVVHVGLRNGRDFMIPMTLREFKTALNQSQHAS